MRIPIPALFAAATIAAAPLPSLAASLGPDDYARVNAALADDHAIPRYRRLADATDAFAAMVGALCEVPGAPALEAARDAYNDAADAWMGIQHIEFGPVELFMRSYRIYFWPDPSKRSAEAVEELIASQGGGEIGQDALESGGVAVQGLPAAEALLYGAKADLLVSGDHADIRCGTLHAIANNLATMAEDIVDDWTAGAEPFRAIVAGPPLRHALYKRPQDITLLFFRALHQGLHVLAETRVFPPLGNSAADARPDLVDGHASGRGVRNLVVAIDVLAALYRGEGEAGLAALVDKKGSDPELGPLMDKAFAKTRETAAGIDLPLGEAVVDDAARQRVETLGRQLKALRQIVATRVAAALDLTVGFNALDGD